MKKSMISLKMVGLGVFVGFLFFLSGCGWHTSRAQYDNGRWYGILRPDEVARMEREQTAIDYRKKTQELEIEKKTMLNKYTIKEMEEGVSVAEGEEKIRGIGFTGFVKNREKNYINQFVIVDRLNPNFGLPFLLNTGEEVWYRLPEGQYFCYQYRNGQQIGKPATLTVNGIKKYALGKWTYWYCTTGE